jgi:hypothetical protein
VGVTDYTFNSINAIFGRALKTANGHIVTLAYWEQKTVQAMMKCPIMKLIKSMHTVISFTAFTIYFSGYQ